MNLIEFVDLKLSILTVISQIFIVLSFAYFIFIKKDDKGVGKFISKHGLFLAFLTVLAATLGSLFYSEVAGYDPCDLCWYQRIFMYPLVILLIIALFKKDKGVIKYAMTLSAIGVMLAIYHYFMQTGLIEGLACSVVGYSASCTKLFVMKFGYITLPLMSFTSFAQTLVLLYFAKSENSK
ncbi:MAG: disulfide bond formation protein B [Candidatus Staskawiczbacteria bacterium]|nr:disulfide bond formation protein B [Candidatus Staskawiczbacteria bacterium]